MAEDNGSGSEYEDDESESYGSGSEYEDDESGSYGLGSVRESELNEEDPNVNLEEEQGANVQLGLQGGSRVRFSVEGKNKDQVGQNDINGDVQVDPKGKAETGYYATFDAAFKKFWDSLQGAKEDELFATFIVAALSAIDVVIEKGIETLKTRWKEKEKDTNDQIKTYIDSVIKNTAGGDPGAAAAALTEHVLGGGAYTDILKSRGFTIAPDPEEAGKVLVTDKEGHRYKFPGKQNEKTGEWQLDRSQFSDGDKALLVNLLPDFNKAMCHYCNTYLSEMFHLAEGRSSKKIFKKVREIFQTALDTIAADNKEFLKSKGSLSSDMKLSLLQQEVEEMGLSNLTSTAGMSDTIIGAPGGFVTLSPVEDLKKNLEKAVIACITNPSEENKQALIRQINSFHKPADLEKKAKQLSGRTRALWGRSSALKACKKLIAQRILGERVAGDIIKKAQEKGQNTSVVQDIMSKAGISLR